MPYIVSCSLLKEMRFILVIIGALFVSSTVLTGCKGSSDKEETDVATEKEETDVATEKEETDVATEKEETDVATEKEAERITNAAIRGKKPSKYEVSVVYKYAIKNGYAVELTGVEEGLNLLAELKNEQDQTKKIEIAKRIQAFQQKMQL